MGSDLLGKQLNNARVRLLTPISEEGSLFGTPTPRSARSMILLTSRVPNTPFSPEQGNNRMPQIQNQRLLPAVPLMYTSPELQSLMSRYLGQPSYGNYNLTRTRHGNNYFCKCCEPMNEINRAKRKRMNGEPEDLPPEEIPSDSNELVPLFAHRVRPQIEHSYTELIDAGRPGEYPTFATHNFFPASGTYDRWDEKTAPGTAALTYGYSPRRADHYYSTMDYDMRLGSENPGERIVKESLLQASSRYDASMAKLKGTVDHFYEPKQRVTFRD